MDEWRPFPPEMAGRPLEDVDAFYAESGKATYMLVTKVSAASHLQWNASSWLHNYKLLQARRIYRYSAAPSLQLLSPFNPIRSD